MNIKFLITIPANVLIVYGSEVYEWKVRTFGVSSINFWRRLGTILSPFIVTYFEDILGELGPFYLFTPLAAIGFILSLLLQIETSGVPLDEININPNN